jgi:uncharacterized membrane protein YdbT with pleckstrin-like domain
MAGYAESLLTRGEVVAVRGRQHFLATIVDGRRAWALFLLAILILFVGLNQAADVQPWLVVPGAAILVVSLVWLGIRYWDWLNQEYLVTNRRVIKVEGIINKRAADSSLEKINDAVLDQNLVGRIFGYADLAILTAADQAIDKFNMLGGALAFKKAMLEQKHELELELGRSTMIRPDDGPEPVARPRAEPAPERIGVPSPLVRATETASASGGTLGAAPGTSNAPPMTADEITAAIDDLADLRDRGAVTPAEFETKKADLLRRL